MTPQLREVLSHSPSYNFNRRATPAELFTSILTPEIVQKMLLHSYRTYDPNGGAGQSCCTTYNLHDFYRFLAERLFIWKYRSTSKGVLKDQEVLDATQFPQPLVMIDGETKPVSHFFMSRYQYLRYKCEVPIPSHLISHDITEKLSKMVNNKDVLNILDERKHEYHGATDCIRMNRSTPVLWMMQVATMLPGASFPFVFRLLPFDWPKVDKKMSKTKVNLLQFAFPDLGGNAAVVMDSFYSSPDALQWLEARKILFLTSLHKQWWSRPWNAMLSTLIDYGNIATLSSPSTALGGVDQCVGVDEGPQDDEGEVGEGEEEKVEVGEHEKGDLQDSESERVQNKERRDEKQKEQEREEGKDEEEAEKESQEERREHQIIDKAKKVGCRELQKESGVIEAEMAEGGMKPARCGLRLERK